MNFLQTPAQLQTAIPGGAPNALLRSGEMTADTWINTVGPGLVIVVNGQHTAGQNMTQAQFNHYLYNFIAYLVETGSGDKNIPAANLGIVSSKGTDVNVLFPHITTIQYIKTVTSLKRFARFHAPTGQIYANTLPRLTQWGLVNGFPTDLRAYAFDFADVLPGITPRIHGAILAAKKKAIFKYAQNEQHVLSVAPEYNMSGHLDAADHRALVWQPSN